MITAALAGIQAGSPPACDLVSVTSHRLYACEHGSGPVTVVLDSGMREDSRAWDPVVDQLAAFSRVVTYDRAGTGRSDSGPEPRSVTVMARELASLLDALGVGGPLVLVGHSAGGWRVRRFAQLYPERVAGMLLLDSPHEDFEAFRMSTLDERARAERTRDLTESRAHLPSGVRLEYEGLQDVGAGLRGPLPEVPLVVVSAGRHAWAPEFLAEVHEEGWRGLQRELAQLSPRGRYVLAEEAGHAVQRDDPELVVDLVRGLVNGASGANQEAPPPISATNAFYYYEDVDGAWAFYRDVLGFETVVDYGFAKIMRVAPASYLTLVDAERGMHSADEPKSVTLAIVTEQVEEWHAYLQGRGVPMRAELSAAAGRPHDGFVAIDPEGYYLEFERFNPHAENVQLMPVLSRIDPLAEPERRPAGLEVMATVLWLYYDELQPIQDFYEELLGVDLMVDQGWAKVYQASRTGFIGLVDGSRGLHQATQEKGVTVSFFTEDVDGWFERARGLGVELRTPELTDESGRVRVFVAYDPDGYYLEWDTFRDVEGNERLLELLSGR